MIWNKIINVRISNIHRLAIALLPLAAACQIEVSDGTTDSAPGAVGVGESCGSRGGASCDEGLFCDYALDAICGAADAPGTCQPIPEVCTEEYNPVCGCDGRTYGNECAAHAAGVSVASTGECAPPSGDVCGGLTGLGCSEGSFCNFAPEAACGAADQTGVCEPIPEFCTKEYIPVCGCDGVTYGNACMANASGVSVAAPGECAPPAGDVCGGLAGFACREGFFCNYPLDAMCGAADQTGICEPIPEACIEVYDPVCGCDDVTYSNTCHANAAGVSIASLGECTSRP